MPGFTLSAVKGEFSVTTSWERWYWRQASKDGRGFILEMIRDDVSWERKTRAKVRI